MPDYVKVASLKEIHENCGKLVRINDTDVAIFKRAGKLFAINNVCAHQHFSMLHQGILENLTVTCPMHGWTYDLQTGKSTTGQGKVATYNIKVEGEDILIEVPV
jgi:NAD(P)H-dependent nitrite reductase small subunit